MHSSNSNNDLICGSLSYEDIFIFFLVLVELSVSISWNDFFLLLDSRVCGSIRVFDTLALGILNCLDLLLLLFVILGFLQTHEIFTIDFVKFLLDIINDFIDTRN